MERCTEHPAYEADYCPRCGTATKIPQTMDEIRSLVVEDEPQDRYSAGNWVGRW